MKKVLYIDGNGLSYHYTRCGMVNMSVYVRNIRNDTNHKETSCEMDCTVSELHRIVFESTMYLCSG